ncbi:hypothetical protein C0992_006221, partial [Termitomyces sp. T32_za158]
HEAHSASQVDIQVWYRSQSKRKAKKRTLVASTSHTIGELARLQDKEHRKEVELRLQCKSVAKRAISSRGRPQDGATLLIKMCLPARAKERILESKSVNETWEVASSSSHAGSPTQVSGLPSTPKLPTHDTWPGLDRPFTNACPLRHQRGYRIHSDDESTAYDDDDDHAPEPPVFSDGDEDGYSDDDSSTGPIVPSPARPQGWIYEILPSLLPQYTERIEVPMMLVESVLASFTMYNELKNANYGSAV